MKYCIFVSILLNTALFSCKGKVDDSKKNQAKPAPQVDVMVASYQSIEKQIEVTGTVLPDEFVEIRPEISGLLTYLNVKEGSFVSKGTVLAKINNADLTAQLNKLYVQLALAKTTEQRYKKLLDINGINRADYDITLNQVNNIQADIDVQKVLISKSIVTAPFSGVLGLRRISPGSYVNNTTILTSLQKTDRLKMDFSVPEEYASGIKIGNQVMFKLNNDSGHFHKATIIATEPQANMATRNITVRALLENGIANPGAFVKVIINDITNDHSVMVPTSAIIPEDLNKILVTVKNGNAAYTKVETGMRNADNIEITKGILPGDTIVVSGVLFTRPNTPVKVRKVIVQKN